MKSLSEQVGPDVTSLSTLLVSALRTLINGNQVQADDLKAGVATLQMATIRLQLDWAFQAETTDIVNSGSMGKAASNLPPSHVAGALSPRMKQLLLHTAKHYSNKRKPIAPYAVIFLPES